MHQWIIWRPDCCTEDTNNEKMTCRYENCTQWTIQTYPKEKLSICWAVVITPHSMSAMRAVMWLAEWVSINHHVCWSIVTFTQPFCTLCCCTYINQNSRCAWRCPHYLWSQDHFSVCEFTCQSAVKGDPVSQIFITPMHQTVWMKTCIKGQPLLFLNHQCNNADEQGTWAALVGLLQQWKFTGFYQKRAGSWVYFTFPKQTKTPCVFQCWFRVLP